jgi:hypothetical protein
MIKISTRLVFVFKKFVIKIPLSYRGYLQCKNESYIWNKYKNPILGELYWFKYGIVCMKKYKIAKHIPAINVIEIKEIIPELNVELCDLYNYKNWGVYDEKYILIDYGINEQISKMYKIK